MNGFIDGATYKVVSNDWTNGHLVTYDKSQHRFKCKDFNFYASFLVTKNCNINVKLMAMGPAPTMPTPRPFANIDDLRTLLGLEISPQLLDHAIDQIHWHLVDNYCIAEDADFDTHMGFYRKDCTDEQALRKAVKRIRRQNKQYEELHDASRQLEQHVKVLQVELNELHNALMCIGDFGPHTNVNDRAIKIRAHIVILEKKVKELNEKYVEPVEKMCEVFADHSNKFFKPTTLNQARISMGREPIKSDGLSSSYYSLMINGNSVETEDVIRDVFGNDFDFGNVFKCLVRMYGAKQGAGKAGASIEYDGNKIHYSINKITGKGNDRG